MARSCPADKSYALVAARNEVIGHRVRGVEIRIADGHIDGLRFEITHLDDRYPGERQQPPAVFGVRGIVQEDAAWTLREKGRHHSLFTVQAFRAGAENEVHPTCAEHVGYPLNHRPQKVMLDAGNDCSDQVGLARP